VTDADPQEESPVEIHKPKRWRGFVKEYVIIVVGVLTALGGQQAVEWLNDRRQAQIVEADLAAGLQVDLINAVQWVALEPCNRARVQELVTALQQPGPAWKASQQTLAPGAANPRVPPGRRVFTNPAAVWSYAPWEAAVASGALLQMPRARVQAYADIYRLVDVARDGQNTLGRAVTPKLAALGYDRNLSEAERTQYINLVFEIDQITAGMAGSGRQILRRAHAIGIDPDPKKVEERIKGDRERGRGACVVDVPLPLAPNTP
jgi:hypothetical protein